MNAIAPLHVDQGPCSHEAPAPAALTVLTDPTLWRNITPFMTGWPFPIFRLWKQCVPKYTLHDTSWFSRNKFPKERGAIPHVAIAENDQRVLGMVYELHKVPDNRDNTLLTMEKCMACAIHYGRLEILKWMVETAKSDPERWVWEENLMINPIDHRDYDMMQFLYENCPRASTRISYDHLKVVVWDDDLELVKWVYDRDYEFGEQGNSRPKYLMDHAASLEMLQLMHSHRLTDVGYSSRVMQKAVHLGDLRMITFLFDRHHDLWSCAIDDIAGKGFLEIVKRVHKNPREGFADGLSTHAMDSAAANGYLEMVKFLHENRTEGCTTFAMDAAAAHGHLDVVRFLHEYRSEGCTQHAMDKAAKNGHLDIVKFLHEYRREGCTFIAMDRAVANRDLKMVKFLHENRSEGCTVGALQTAILNDDFEMFKFLCDNQAEGFTSQVVDIAVSKGQLEVVRILHENSIRGNGRKRGCKTSAMDAAATRGSLDIVRFLHENRSEGCTTKAMDAAAANGHLEVVRFLHENRSEGCTFRALNNAAANGHLEVVRLLYEKRSEGCASEALDTAAGSGHVDVVGYLQEFVEAEEASKVWWR